MNDNGAAVRELAERIHRLETAVAQNSLTEERVMAIATSAADLAVEKITTNFYATIGKRTLTIIGAVVIVIVLWLHDTWLPSWLRIQK